MRNYSEVLVYALNYSINTLKVLVSTTIIEWLYWLALPNIHSAPTDFRTSQ